ncbi:DUF4880 domain-containing protein [Comamonadaceae bacterium OH2545_COT-014]|nr:DUF4880 domain-containing protein [Comamonadaceae bacterium OH2545_COT-014]
MAGGEPLRAAVADQAAAWLTVLMSGQVSESQRRQWQQWRAAHPDHERAWRHIEAVTARLRGLDPQAGYHALSPFAPPQAAARQQRRQAVRRLAVGGAGLAASLLAATRTPVWQRQMADHHTATGQQLALTLDDGTRLTLNTASAVNVRFTPGQRLLHLVAGEVLVATVHAAAASATAASAPGRAEPDAPRAGDPRPLIVQTAQGRIRALGTRFAVRQQGGATRVAVLESAVEITPADGGAPRRLLAGQRTDFTRAAVAPPQPLDANADGWARGQLVAADMLLGEFLDELARYRPGVLRCAPEVAGLRLSGVYPLHDTDRVLAALPSVLPVQVRVRPWWVTVEAAR